MQPPFSRLQLYLSRGALVADTWPYVEAVSWAAVTEFTVTEDHLKLLRHVHLYWDYGDRPPRHIGRWRVAA
jgi:sulfur relay (sulfurtransferase) DsrC/TusE family protein